MNNLKITCKLQQNSQLINYEPMQLDSIVGYRVMQELHKGKPNIDEVVDMPLPIEKLWDEPLCYNATALIPQGEIINDVQYLHKRVQNCVFTKGKNDVFRLQTAAGRFQERRIPVPTIVANDLVAYCVGDAEQLQYHLNKVRHLGKRRNIGFGCVDKWVIEESTIKDFLIVGGKLTRPIPKELAEFKGWHFECEPYYISIRPPYWHGSTKTLGYNTGDKLI